MMDLHMLSDPVTDFWKWPKKGFQIFFLHFLIGSTKTQFKSLEFGMVVNWHKYFFCRYTQEKKKRGFRGSLRSDFDINIDQSNVNGFSWIFFFSLIIKINYLQARGPKGPPSPPQELEVGGHRPPYLLVHIKNQAWSPSSSVTFFTSTFTSTEVPLFSDK